MGQIWTKQERKRPLICIIGEKELERDREGEKETMTTMTTIKTIKTITTITTKTNLKLVNLINNESWVFWIVSHNKIYHSVLSFFLPRSKKRQITKKKLHYILWHFVLHLKVKGSTETLKPEACGAVTAVRAVLAWILWFI